MSIFQIYALSIIAGLVGVLALGFGVHLRRCAPYRKIATRR